MLFDKFKQSRLSKGLTQREFARRHKVTQAMVNRAEKGQLRWSGFVTMAKAHRLKIVWHGLPDGGNIGSRWKALRTSQQLSLRGYADKVGIAIDTVHDWERGQKDLLMRTVLDLCHGAGVTISLEPIEPHK